MAGVLGPSGWRIPSHLGSVPLCPPVLDMQQTYDMWLKKHNPGKPGEGTPIGSREGEKQIQMPTDYADIMVTPHPHPPPPPGPWFQPDPETVGGALSLSGQRREGEHPWWLCSPDGLPLLALRQEQQQQEAVAAAHPVREAQGEGLHVGQRRQRLGLPLPHGRVPALRQVLGEDRAMGGAAKLEAGLLWLRWAWRVAQGVGWPESAAPGCGGGIGSEVVSPALQPRVRSSRRPGHARCHEDKLHEGSLAQGRWSSQPRVPQPLVESVQGLGSEPPAARRLQKGKACPDGDKCRCAHGQEELNEWLDRREVLKQKLAKARKDMLLCPRDDDFGKYNFLLQEDGNTAGATPEAPAAATIPGE